MPKIQSPPRQLRPDTENNVWFECNKWKQAKKLLEHTMISNDPVIVNLFSKFVTACFADRENSLKSMEQNAVAWII